MIVGSAKPAGAAPAAVLWDMDGLLVDSEPLWTIAERELCHSLGVEFGPEAKALIVGRRVDESVPLLLAYTGVAADPQEATNRLVSRVAELFREGVVLQPGAEQLLTELTARAVPQALVSASHRVLVDALPPTLRARFATTVAGDEVAAGKPDPAGYLTAASRLGVDPRRCVVLEDTLAGARAGMAAGCRVIVVPSVTAVPDGPGYEVIGSLSSVSVSMLAEPVAGSGS